MVEEQLEMQYTDKPLVVNDRVFVPASNNEWELGAGIITGLLNFGGYPCANVFLDKPTARHESDHERRSYTVRLSGLIHEDEK